MVLTNEGNTFCAGADLKRKATNGATGARPPAWKPKARAAAATMCMAGPKSAGSALYLTFVPRVPKTAHRRKVVFAWLRSRHE